MLRWDLLTAKEVHDHTIDMFLNDLIALCLKYHVTLSHEDSWGAFIISHGDPDKIDREHLLTACKG